jgi:hypothetical protein
MDQKFGAGASIMYPALPLNEMTTADKLSMMELLWDDLCRTPEEMPSPAWHSEVLADREKRLQNGQTQFSDFAEVQERLRKALP